MSASEDNLAEAPGLHDVECEGGYPPSHSMRDSMNASEDSANRRMKASGFSPASFIASFFYLGYSPFMPGTVGSLGGVLVYLLVNNNEALYGFAILFLFVLGIMFSGEAERIYGKKDAGIIVIDEACGMLLALYFVPVSVFSVILGFFIFRILDVLKPPPARRLEKLPGAMGIMMDDIVAAIYTNLTLQIIFRGICIKT